MAWFRRLFASFGVLVLVLFVAAPEAVAAPRSTAFLTAARAQSPTECSADFYQGDRRLGPETLPTLGKVGYELGGYERTGDLTPEQFLNTFYDPAANAGQGGWRYPPQNGYTIGPDGQPIEFQLTLTPGVEMDRFGSEYGSFLAPDGLSYSGRSLPPASLDSVPAASCNYHEYRVLRSFTVDAGPIAPWFDQPGGGLQYQLDGTLVPGAPASLNVMYLVENGYLARLN
jgi:hypothetical protein